MTAENFFESSLAKEKSPLQDHCGLVAIYAKKDKPLFELGLRGLHTLQTRGNDGAGMVCVDSQQNIITHKDRGLISEVFPESVSDRLGKISAKTFIFQVRYGTSGNFSPANVQPFIGENHKEPFVVAHNGQFANESSQEYAENSDTLIFTQQLAERNEISWDWKIIKTLEEKRGAWSLVIVAPNAMYLARDPLGIRPLTYTNLNGAWGAASETSALDQMGATGYTEVMPGQIVKITDARPEVIQSSNNYKSALCIFEDVYICDGNSRVHRPRSTSSEVNYSPTIEEIRRRCGEILAKESPLTTDQVDFVIGIPGTAIPGGQAYAKALDLPYIQAIFDRNSPDEERRTFMTAEISTIPQKVQRHFIFNEKALHGSRVVLIDDSIVRGNISKGLNSLLKESYGVVETHWRVLSPRIDNRCHLGVNTRKSTELIAARYDSNLKLIEAEIGADSLAYLSPQGLRKAITGNPNVEGFCMGCMTGQTYPIDEYGQLINQHE